MDKNRLTRVLDIAFVVVAFCAIDHQLYYPGTRDFAGIWECRHELFRVGVLLLWLAALWIGAYRPWDAAKRVNPAAVMLGAALMLCVAGDYYFTGFIIVSTVARFTQLLYGGWLMLNCAVAYALQWALVKANADVPEFLAASRVWRRRLAVAFALLAAGEIVCALWMANAARYFACLAALCLLGLERTEALRKPSGDW